jgi:hypothetical protein
LEGAEGHFCCRSLRRKHIDPFDVSRDGKRRKKCGFRPFLWKYTHGARERAAQNQKKKTPAATSLSFVSTGIVTANGCVGTLQASCSFSKWLQGDVQGYDQLRYVAKSTAPKSPSSGGLKSNRTPLGGAEDAASYSQGFSRGAIGIA